METHRWKPSLGLMIVWVLQLIMLVGMMGLGVFGVLQSMVLGSGIEGLRNDLDRQHAEQREAMEAERSEVKKTPKWEYKAVYIHSEGHERLGDAAARYSTITPNDSDMSELGSKGWELVTSYLEVETAFPNFGNDKYVSGIQSNVRPQRLVLIFKRPLSSGDDS